MKLEYHSENGIAPWVWRVNGLWLAYPSLWRALRKAPHIARLQRLIKAH